MVNEIKLNEKTAQNVRENVMNLSQETIDLFEVAYKSQYSTRAIEEALKLIGDMRE
jgi:hypothetical protein